LRVYDISKIIIINGKTQHPGVLIIVLQYWNDGIMCQAEFPGSIKKAGDPLRIAGFDIFIF
jgi:hypothetical protein